MSYAELDTVINAWAKKHPFQRFDQCADRECRAFYIWIGRNGGEHQECFQISISPMLKHGKVRMCVHGIETINDQYFHRKWFFDSSELDSKLEESMRLVLAWSNRGN